MYRIPEIDNLLHTSSVLRYFTATGIKIIVGVSLFTSFASTLWWVYRYGVDISVFVTCTFNFVMILIVSSISVVPVYLFTISLFIKFNISILRYIISVSIIFPVLFFICIDVSRIIDLDLEELILHVIIPSILCYILMIVVPIRKIRSTSRIIAAHYNNIKVNMPDR